ncbi:MAG: UMP kinase [Candidatus Heimdallarchaeota archaeon]|nr:UMP kinase [Candidatus Heimdallarchaeota archaeon]
MMYVVKIGGSLLFNEKEQIKQNLISNYAKTIKNIFSQKKEKCAIVVGGGKLARKYVASTRAFGSSESYNDVIGIEAAKLNARLLISALGDFAYPNPPESFQDFLALYHKTEKIIVCGGFQPGQSTNAVAALIAESTHAKKIINMTDVNGVYSEDPDKNPEAKLLLEINIKDFSELITSMITQAGNYPLFDLTALQIIQRSKIPLNFINGSEPNNLAKAVNNELIGTMVIY